MDESEGKQEFYYTMNGSSTFGWSLNIYKYHFRPNSKEYTVVPYWAQPKEFKTFKELIEKVEEINNEVK